MPMLVQNPMKIAVSVGVASCLGTNAIRKTLNGLLAEKAAFQIILSI